MAGTPTLVLFLLHVGFLALSAPVYAGPRDVPEIASGTIIFTSGKTLQYHAKKVLFSNPEEALRKQEPVSISEEPKLIQRWKRLVLIRTLNYYEGGEKEIIAFDYAGNILSSPQRIVGEVFILEASKRIFLGGRSSHSYIDKSVLLDKNGTIVREITQPRDVFDFGFSHDGEIIWILSNSSKMDGTPVGHVQIIDSNGNQIKNVDFLKAMEIQVAYKGKTYKISLPEPKLPG